MHGDLYATRADTTLAEFGEETVKKLERRARDKDGKVMKVPADMSYREWAEENSINAVKSIDKSHRSGIIEVGSEEMYRKNIGFKIEPMPKKQLQRIVKRFKERGGIIQFDEATDAYLESKNAEAITYNATTILLRRNAGRASVFEELIHATQYRNGENDGTYVSRLRCEIAAQKKLIKYAQVYKLTENEIIQTKSALEAYEHELSEYIKNGGA